MGKIKKLIINNFERVFVIGAILVSAFITYLMPNSLSFLNFFFLPIILAGYYVGLRLSVLGAVFCIAVVLIYAIMYPSKYQPPQSPGQIALFVLTWGCFLILAGAVVGHQQEQIRRENQAITRLHAEVLDSLEKIKKARKSTVVGLATLTECRDRDTGLHLERVAEYCRILATELRRKIPFDSYITEEYIEDLALSSILHDIGKVGVPDSILLKPDKLNRDEFDKIKTHTLIGGDALKAIEARIEGRTFFTLGKEVAYSHHEKWNGTGYPHGLSGNNIPLSARIVALADAYDAITSDRIYCKAKSHEEAKEIIKNLRGSSFDPNVVDAFMASADAIKLICLNLNDKRTLIKNSVSATVDNFA